ncbi:MAG TPA: flagellar basal body-associated FliL family protein [Alphaproteobacteria bacterium]|nr:flagellar basal body-associated FliL family protein [Alphaproteobacteria bacterium]
MTDQTMDETAAEEPAKVPKKGFGGKKLILFIVLPILLLCGGAAAVYFTGAFGLIGKKEAEVQPQKPKQAIFYSIPDILVNLNSVNKKTHFLKLSIAFELNEAADQEKLQAVMPRIIDNFQVYLRELHVEDLAGATGIQRLREELLVRVNSAIQPVVVKDVLFKEMLVQ